VLRVYCSTAFVLPTAEAQRLHSIHEAPGITALYATANIQKLTQHCHTVFIFPRFGASQVARWYQGWKSLFPLQLVTDAGIAAQFTAALAAMDSVLRSTPPAPPQLTGVSYASVLAVRRADAAAARERAARTAVDLRTPATTATASANGSSSSSGTRTHTGDVGVSFREVVEQFAAKHGIEFVPRVGRMRLGRQLFAFGGVTVYLDSNVAYVEVSNSSSSNGSGSEQWQPVSLQDLLQYVNNKQKSSR
jgi:tuftelin-interacting protein 11